MLVSSEDQQHLQSLKVGRTGVVLAVEGIQVYFFSFILFLFYFFCYSSFFVYSFMFLYCY